MRQSSITIDKALENLAVEIEQLKSQIQQIETAVVPLISNSGALQTDTAVTLQSIDLMQQTAAGLAAFTRNLANSNIPICELNMNALTKQVALEGLKARLTSLDGQLALDQMTSSEHLTIF